MPQKTPSVSVRVIRSRRRSIALEITPAGDVLVRAPQRMPEKDIRRFVQDKQDWILTHLDKVRRRQAQHTEPPLTEPDIRSLAQQALEVLPPRVDYFAEKVGVTYGNITVRNQKTRWGSCSSRGNLNFNCLLMLTPPEVQDYVVVHELCHRLEMNHSPRFWAQVEWVLPDYRRHRQWLKDNGGALIARMLNGAENGEHHG